MNGLRERTTNNADTARGAMVEARRRRESMAGSLGGDVVRRDGHCAVCERTVEAAIHVRLSSAIAGSVHRCPPTLSSTCCWARDLRWLHNLVSRDGEHQARRPKPSSMTSAWLLRASARTLTSVVKRRRPTNLHPTCSAAELLKIANLGRTAKFRTQSSTQSPNHTHPLIPQNTHSVSTQYRPTNPNPIPHPLLYATPKSMFVAKTLTAFTDFSHMMTPSIA
jgi:hypothetical protein